MRIFYWGVLLYSCFLISCQSGNTDHRDHDHSHSHDDHDHDHGGHDHDHDHSGHDHDHDHDHDHSGHDHSQDEHDDHDHDHDHELEDGQVELSNQQFERLGLQVERVNSSPFSQIIRSAGRLEIPTGEERVITARSNGILTFVKKDLTSGAPLRQGEALAYISDKNMADGDQISRLELERSRAELEYQRAEQLIQDSLISVAEYQQARATYEAARLAAQTLSSRVSDRGVAVSSDMNGYLRTILTDEGSYVQAGQAIATVGSSDRLRLRVDLTENYASQLHLIRTANFRTADGQEIHDISEMNGRLVSFARSLDPKSMRLPVYFEFDHAAHLMPGSFVEVYLKTRATEALTLPLTALIEEQGMYSVYIQEEPTIYRKLPVQIGQSDGLRVEIKSGLQNGMPVVIRGAYHLKLASMSAAIPHGHAH